MNKYKITYRKLSGGAVGAPQTRIVFANNTAEARRQVASKDILVERIQLIS